MKFLDTKSLIQIMNSNKIPTIIEFLTLGMDGYRSPKIVNLLLVFARRLVFLVVSLHVLDKINRCILGNPWVGVERAGYTSRT